MLSVNYDQAKESSAIFSVGAKCEDWMAQLMTERKREDKRWEEPLEEKDEEAKKATEDDS